MHPSALQALQKKLQEREKNQARRSLRVDPGLIDFCSNDYLGYAGNPELKAIADSIYPIDYQRLNGSTGSRLLRGNTFFGEETESFIAAYHEAESALVFNSGYDANLGFFSSVPQKGDVILYDKLIHASIHDGMRLSNAEATSFRHNDLDHLRNQLGRTKGNRFVVVESVYSMDGDRAPLEDLVTMSIEENFYLVVDEAHAMGVFGSKGEGLVSGKLAENCFARIYTYGKAMGSHGAAILGSSVLRDYLINYARSFIYTTALPPYAHALIRAAYLLLERKPEFRAILHDRVSQFRHAVSGAGLKFVGGDSAIQSLIIGGNEETRRVAGAIQLEGMDVRAILSPTVPAGQERLRICLHRFNSAEEVNNLIFLLKNLLG